MIGTSSCLLCLETNFMAEANLFWTNFDSADFDSPTIIKKYNTLLDLDIFEAFYAHKFSNSLVEDLSGSYISTVWVDSLCDRFPSDLSPFVGGLSVCFLLSFGF